MSNNEFFRSKNYWNKNQVKIWLGYENNQTINSSIKYVEQHYKAEPDGWLKPVLKPKKEESTLIQNISRKPVKARKKARQVFPTGET